jgi:hypothetical protein
MKSLRLQLKTLALATSLTGIALSGQTQTTLVLSNAWTLPAGSYGFMAASGNNPRGLALNRVTGNVLVPSTTGSNTLQVINGTDGSLLGGLNQVNPIQGGSIAFILQGAVADDGVVYACNADVNQNFRIYRWDAEDLTGTVNPTLAFAGVTATNVANNRAGDAFYVRGAGTNTQIIATGTGSSFFSVFTTADGTNFTATSIRLPAPLDPGGARRGVAFDGTNNAFYAIAPNSTLLYRVGFNLTLSNATVLATNTLSTAIGMISVRTVNGTKILAGIQDNGGNPGTHNLVAFDITAEPTINSVVGGLVPFPAPAVQDVNITGGTDISTNKIVALNTHNGIVALSNVFIPPVAPSITANPASQTVIQTWTATFTGGASGTQPKFQWYFAGNSINGATNSTLNVPNVSAASAGDYYFVVTNTVGTANSTTGALFVLPSGFTSVATPIWRITNGTRPFLANDNNARGLAYHALSNQVLVASRTGGTKIHVLNAATGASVTNLDMTSVGGQPSETFPLNLIATTADGKVYGANLSDINTGAGFTIYKWDNANPSTTSSVIYGPANPLGVRVGDTFTVLNGSAGPMFVVASANADTVAVINDLNSPGTYVADSIAVADAAPGFAGLGLAASPAYSTTGSDHSLKLWAKSTGSYLREIRLNKTGGTWSGYVSLTNLAALNQVSAIGFDSGNELIGGVGLQTPDNFQLFDVYGTTNLANSPLMDREFFPTDNANGNATGAAAFDVTGGRIFTLDSNNGILALKYAPPLRFTSSGSTLTLSWAGPATLRHSTTVTGTYTNVPSATSPFVTSQPGYYRLEN